MRMWVKSVLEPAEAHAHGCAVVEFLDHWGGLQLRDALNPSVNELGLLVASCANHTGEHA